MEYWDAYDKDLNKIDGITLVRGEPIPENVYHLVCETVVKHVDGTYLLMQRDFNKHLGGLWELTAGGSALSGETPLECAVRELMEDTAIKAESLTKLGTVYNDKRRTVYCEYLCITDSRKTEVKLQKGKTINYKWVTAEYLKALSNSELACQRTRDWILKNG